MCTLYRLLRYSLSSTGQNIERGVPTKIVVKGFFHPYSKQMSYFLFCYFCKLVLRFRVYWFIEYRRIWLDLIIYFIINTKFIQYKIYVIASKIGLSRILEDQLIGSPNFSCSLNRTFEGLDSRAGVWWFFYYYISFLHTCIVWYPGVSTQKGLSFRFTCACTCPKYPYIYFITILTYTLIVLP